MLEWVAHRQSGRRHRRIRWGGLPALRAFWWFGVWLDDILTNMGNECIEAFQYTLRSADATWCMHVCRFEIFCSDFAPPRNVLEKKMSCSATYNRYMNHLFHVFFHSHKSDDVRGGITSDAYCHQARISIDRKRGQEYGALIFSGIYVQYCVCHSKRSAKKSHHYARWHLRTVKADEIHNCLSFTPK